MPASSRCDVLIAGGGANGLALALALRRGLGPGAGILLADPALARRDAGDARAYAIAAAGRRMLTALGVWSALEAQAEPVHDMVISDSRTRDVVRPVFLTFAEERAAGDPVAHIVSGEALTVALEAQARADGITLLPMGVKEREPAADHLQSRTRITLNDGSQHEARLLVAADGARSRLREQAGIGWVSWGYDQTGIVATIAHERPHQGRAVEHFLPDGPFAILPLGDDAQGRHRSSIVWSEASANAGPLLELDPRDLMGEIEIRFGHELGAIALLDTPRGFPLRYGIARSFIGDRLALMGDAAHVVHPIAGQGLNLGLKDAAALAEIVVDAARLGLDIGSGAVLARYEKARRFDTAAMGLGMDALNRLFSNDLLPVRLARDLGLGLVDRMPALKRFFMAQAAGESASAPRLMRGQPL